MKPCKQRIKPHSLSVQEVTTCTSASETFATLGKDDRQNGLRSTSVLFSIIC